MKDQWIKEFEEFSQGSSESVQVPSSLFSKIKKRLFPNPWVVFGKITAIHAFVGFLSLGICSQFGLNPFNTGYSLSEWFMQKAGHNVCMIFCGIFFVASTYLLANLILNLEELEAIRKFQWLQVGILSIGSLAAFHFFGGEIVMSVALLWLVGAFIGGLISIEGSFRIRRQLYT